MRRNKEIEIRKLWSKHQQMKSLTNWTTLKQQAEKWNWKWAAGYGSYEKKTADRKCKWKKMKMDDKKTWPNNSMLRLRLSSIESK